MSDTAVEPTGVNPDGTPTHVAPGEPVESAWGNAVVDTLMGVKASNDAQNPLITNATNAANNAQATANQGVAAAGNAQAAANSANSRAYWLRENSNDQAFAAQTFYITTNGNGEFWCVFPFVLDINSAFGFLTTADINIGAWCVVPDSGNNQIHGRMFSTSGFVPNLAVAVNGFLIGHRAAPYP